MATKSQNIRYMPGVDHLRAAAALTIVLYHGMNLLGYRALYGKPFDFDHWEVAGNPFSAFLMEGHTVVGLFMVLSGFVLSMGALGRKVRFTGFMANRLLSIYPLYLALFMAGLYAYPQNFTFTGFVQVLFMLNNLPGALNLGAFTTIFWFVTAWVLCYMLFPFLHDAMEKRGLRYALGLIALMLLVRLISYKLGANIRDLSYGTVVGRLDQFVIGMALARIYVKVDWSRRAWLVALAASAASVLAMVYIFNSLGGWPVVRSWKVHWPTVEGLVWAAFLLSYVKATEGIDKEGMLNRALSHVGSLGYSLIMLHLVITDLVIQKHWSVGFGFSAYADGALNTALIILPLTILLSLFTHSLIEQPFQSYKVRYYED